MQKRVSLSCSLERTVDKEIAMDIAAMQARMEAELANPQVPTTTYVRPADFDNQLNPVVKAKLMAAGDDTLLVIR